MGTVRSAFLLCLAAGSCTGDIFGAGSGEGAGSDPAGSSGSGGGRAGAGAPVGPGGGGGAGASAGAGAAGVGVLPPIDLPASDVVTTRLARLSHTQWENAVRDLLKLPAVSGYAANFTGDPVRGRFDQNGGVLQVTTGLRTDYQRAAEALAERVTADAAARERLLPPGLPADASGRARGFIEGFGLRAYRRPLTAAEVQRYVALFAKGREVYGGPDPFVDGVRISLEAFLQSAHFLYRTELAPAAGAGRQPLGPYEVAAKLSFTVAGTMPDAELFAAAMGRELTTKEGARRHAERLLATPAADETIEDFHDQLLRLPTYDQIEKDAKLFPEYVAGIGADMRRETLMFARDIVQKGGGLRELLLSAHTFVNRRLAPIYKVAAPASATTFQRTALNPAERAGLLTQVGFLASNAYSREVDSIHRGVFVHHTLLCTNLPPPVDGVSLSGARGTTNRERITSVTGDGTCGAGCHSRIINPVGFAFEGYDALGRYRTIDNGVPVDASGSYAFGGTPRAFKDAVEFSRLAAESVEAHDCYGKSLFEYVHGRVPEAGDDPQIKLLGARSLGGKAAVKALVLDLVTSDEFLSRLP